MPMTEAWATAQRAQEVDITQKPEAVEDVVSALQFEKVVRFTYPLSSADAASASASARLTKGVRGSSPTARTRFSSATSATLLALVQASDAAAWRGSSAA
jgi:hypothetical protein